MSALLQKIKDAQLVARKNREADKALALTTLIGEVTTLAKTEGDREVADKDVIKKLTAFRDNAQANAQIYGDRRDEENFDRYSKEADLYNGFLPAPKPQLDNDKLLTIIKTLIKGRMIGEPQQKPKMGVILADLKILHEGEYDPKVAAQLAKDELSLILEPMVPAVQS